VTRSYYGRDEAMLSTFTVFADSQSVETDHSLNKEDVDASPPTDEQYAPPGAFSSL